MNMKKVYIVMKRWFNSESYEEEVHSVFEKEEDANNTRDDLEHLEKTIDRRDVSFYVDEYEIAESKVEVYPKKLRFYAPLKMNNNPGRVQLTVFHGEEAENPIRFVPLKDNWFSVNSKGDFCGVIDFVPEENYQQHIERAEWFIYDKYDEIVPQWVLDSKDGHDPKHPQGI